MPGETPEKPPLVKKTSIVGALRTGDVKGAVTGVLTAAPLLETKKEKAARHWSVFRTQAPPKFLVQGSPRYAVALSLILTPTTLHPPPPAVLPHEWTNGHSNAHVHIFVCICQSLCMHMCRSL